MRALTNHRAILSGLRIPNGGIATSDDAACEGLAEHWKTTFLWQPSDETAASELKNVVPAIPDIPPPTKAMVAHVVASAKNRALEWDGLPSEAWRALGARALDMIWNTSVWMLAGRWQFAGTLRDGFPA